MVFAFGASMGLAACGSPAAAYGAPPDAAQQDVVTPVDAMNAGDTMSAGDTMNAGDSVSTTDSSAADVVDDDASLVAAYGAPFDAGRPD
jgi:hypothetical protein